MIHQITTRYNVGDKLLFESGLKGEVMKIKINACKNPEVYGVLYLVEYEDETRSWENFSGDKVVKVQKG